MASLAYAGHELRRRAGRTVVTALGLAAGVALVMGITGVSAGLSQAQEQVLSPLTSVGTDILVTRTITPADSAAGGSGAGGSGATGGDPGAGGQAPGRGGFFGPGGGGANARLNLADQQALLQENSTVLTDLSALGPAGTKFSHDFFVPGTLLTFPDQALAEVRKVSGVSSVVGGLTLQAQHLTGTVPTITDEVKTGGQTLTRTIRPTPMTAAERDAMRACLQAKGVDFGGGRSGQGGGGAGGGPGGSSGTGARAGGQGGFRGGGRMADPDFLACMPKRFAEYEAKVVVPQQTIRRVLNPPKTDTASTSYTVAGVDPTRRDAGLITAAQVTSGTWFTPDSAHEVVVARAYADKQHLTVGGRLTVNGTAFRIVGLAQPTLTGNVSDVYFDLATLQKMASKDGRVNELLVKADSSADVDTVAKAISKAMPGAHVVTAASLAAQVTGSLSAARTLADNLGGALVVIVLVSAFAIASLLTVSAVSKRVREIGTLRAVGWSRRRVVSQITVENLGIGALGAVVGVLAGLGLCALVDAYGPSLQATTGGVGIGTPLTALTGTAQLVTRTMSLTAPVSASTVLVGVAVAVVGGLLAGAAGGWRAARMSPSEALRDLG